MQRGRSVSEIGGCPRILPVEHGLLAFPFDGEPNIAAIDGVFRRPAVTAVDEDARFLGVREHIGALGVVGLVRIFAAGRIAQFLPGPPNGIRHGGAGRVGRPAGAAGTDEVILSALLEDGGGFHETALEHADVTTGVGGVGVVKFGDLEGAVLFGGVDMVGFAVIIDEDRHVAGHLAALEIAVEKGGLVHAFGEPASAEALRFGRTLERAFFGREVFGPFAGIDTAGTQEGVGALGTIRHGNATVGGGISFAFEFKVEPHHELPGLCVKDDFGAFKDAAFGDIGLRIIGDPQGDAFILPVDEIVLIGRVTVDADLGVVAGIAGHFVFAEPPNFAAITEEATAVGVDVVAIVVLPEFSGTDEGLRRGGGRQQGRSKREQEQGGEEVSHGVPWVGGGITRRNEGRAFQKGGAQWALRD